MKKQHLQDIANELEKVLTHISTASSGLDIYTDLMQEQDTEHFRFMLDQHEETMAARAKLHGVIEAIYESHLPSMSDEEERS